MALEHKISSPAIDLIHSPFADLFPLLQFPDIPVFFSTVINSVLANLSLFFSIQSLQISIVLSVEQSSVTINSIF